MKKSLSFDRILNVCAFLLCLKSRSGVQNRDTFPSLWVAGLITLLVSAGQGIASSSSSDKLIEINTETEGDCIHFFVKNLQMAEVTVTIDLETKNLEATNSFPYTATFQGYEKTKAFTLFHRDTDKKWTWSYTYYATFGSIDATHDETYHYLLPYAPGAAYRVSQGYNGKYSHHGPDQYAIDWKMPEGTPIHAARDGIVVAVKEDSSSGGPDVKYDRDANFIIIKHSDGTFGHYVHLKKNGVRVKLGQIVNVGDFIGLSGNTGHSTGPHLHFSVFKAQDGKNRETIPVKFRTGNSFAAVTLQRGRMYRSTGIVRGTDVATFNKAADEVGDSAMGGANPSAR